MRELLDLVIGGGWGTDAPAEDSEQVGIIRGADFPAVEIGSTSSIPWRFETSKRVQSRRLQAGDIVLEISGGTKDRPTGRVVTVTAQLLAEAGGSLIPASFCRLLRPNASRVDPEYLYYWLRGMHDAGRTWAYQVQSTGLANFQMEMFLDRELVPLPSLQDQRALASALRTFDELIRTDSRLVVLLSNLSEGLYRNAVSQGADRIRIGDLFTVSSGKFLQKAHRGVGNVPVYGANGVITTTEKACFESAVVVVGRVGACGQVAVTSGPSWVSDNALVVRSKASVGVAMSYELMRSIDYDPLIQGTTQPMVRGTDVANVVALVPRAGDLPSELDALLTLRQSLEEEIRATRARRDACLHMLLSGQLSLEDEAA